MPSRTAVAGLFLLLLSPPVAGDTTTAPSGKQQPPQLQGVSNDTCLDAQLMPVGDVAAGTTLGAKIDDAFGECVIETGFGAGSPMPITAPGVWYVVQGNGNQLSASTCDADSAGSADFDTRISVYCPACSIATCVTANDDSTSACGQQFASTAEWCSQAGLEYHVLVHGFGDSVGDFEVAVQDEGPCTSEPVACAFGDPTGACCSCLGEPFNCTETTQAECEALTANLGAAAGVGYQGDASSCLTGAPPCTVVTDVSVDDPGDDEDADEDADEDSDVATADARNDTAAGAPGAAFGRD